MWFQNRRQKLKKQKTPRAATVAAATTEATFMVPEGREEGGCEAGLAPRDLPEWEAPRSSSPSPSSGGSNVGGGGPSRAETAAASEYLSSVKLALERSRDPTPRHADHPAARKIAAALHGVDPVPLAVPLSQVGQLPPPVWQKLAVGALKKEVIGMPEAYSGVLDSISRSLLSLQALGLDVHLLAALLKAGPPCGAYLPLSTGPFNAALAVPGHSTPVPDAPAAPVGACSTVGELAALETIRFDQIGAGRSLAPFAAFQASAPPIGLLSGLPNGGLPPAFGLQASGLQPSGLQSSGRQPSGPLASYSQGGSASRWTPPKHVETLSGGGGGGGGNGGGDGSIGEAGMAALCEHLGLSLFREGGRKAKQGVQQIPLQGEFATAANIEVERILDGIKARETAKIDPRDSREVQRYGTSRGEAAAGKEPAMPRTCPRRVHDIDRRRNKRRVSPASATSAASKIRPLRQTTTSTTAPAQAPDVAVGF